jgi:hypothetical protein
MALIDHHGDGLAPVPGAPVHEAETVLGPEGWKALKKVAQEGAGDLSGAYRNRDGGFDATRHRTCLFNAGMLPNLKEHPRNRKRTQRGGKRFFNAALPALRMHVARTLAWADTFRRLLLRFDRIQHRHYGMKLMA